MEVTDNKVKVAPSGGHITKSRSLQMEVTHNKVKVSNWRLQITRLRSLRLEIIDNKSVSWADFCGCNWRQTMMTTHQRSRFIYHSCFLLQMYHVWTFSVTKTTDQHKVSKDNWPVQGQQDNWPSHVTMTTTKERMHRRHWTGSLALHCTHSTVVTTYVKLTKLQPSMILALPERYLLRLKSLYSRGRVNLHPAARGVDPHEPPL